MKKLLVSFTLSGLAVLLPCLYLLAPVASAAANAGSGQALEIAPPIITLTGNPGQTLEAQIKLRDISSSDLLVTNQVNDFVAAGEDGTPKILLNDDSNNPYSMKSWIAPLASLNLKPQQIKTLNVSIHIPANASPGGHYGVIRFTGIPPQLQGTGVSLAASLGALMLITVNGHIVHNLSVQQLAVSSNGHTGSMFQSAPLTIEERIKNNGNVQEEPTGLITVKDMFGHVIAGMPINTPPRNVLPGSVRKFTEPLDKTVIGNKRLFGRYTASMKLTYGPDKQTLTASTSFWVIPWRLIITVVVLIIVLFFGLRLFIRNYNQRIISKAQSRVASPKTKTTGRKKR